MTFPMVGTIQRLGVDPCAYTPGLYTQAEVDDLINIDGYIPVASAEEFDLIRTGEVETMGGCSIWAGSYTTGGDKKYIQIFPIDFVAFGTWTTPIGVFGGIYDGNNFNISNVTSTHSLFNCSIANLQNIRVVGLSMSTTSFRQGGLTSSMRGGLIDNVITSGTITSTTNDIGGIAGGNILGSLLADLTISNCVSNINISGVDRCAGIISYTSGTSTFGCTISNCVNNGDITTSDSEAAGICNKGDYTTTTGSVNNGIITGINNTAGIIGIFNNGNVVNCRNNGNVVGSGGYASGISNVGATGQITKCKNTGNVSGTTRVSGIISFWNGNEIFECENIGDIAGTQMVGGIIGNLEKTSSTFMTLSNCFSTGNISASTNESGGLIGRVRWGGNTITNCYAACTFSGSTSLQGGLIGRQFSGSTTVNNTYWDTTIGVPTTTGGGTGKTTSELQTPTSNTGIYSAWTIPPWDFGTATDYPSLTTTP